MRMSVAKSESVMSQPFADIALSSTRMAACALSGYPQVQVQGFVGQGRRAKTARFSIAIHHGLYERADQGPRTVVLRPHHRVFFSIGTGTAYQGGLHPITLTRLIVRLPGEHVATTVRIELFASRLPGHNIPFGITAFTTSPHA